MFSFGVTDIKGVWHDGGWYHTSSDWVYLEFDLRRLYNGTITSISLMLTNDFDPSYAGGKQYAYVQYIAVYRDGPKWTLSCDRPINASISSESGVLKVYGRGNLSAGTIVAAQRFEDVNVDASIYRYLRVSIRTSSVNIAAIVVIWTTPSQPRVILLKTYNDADWHTEIVDLSFFGLTGSLYMIELTWMQIYDSLNSSSIAWYRELSFNKLEV